MDDPAATRKGNPNPTAVKKYTKSDDGAPAPAPADASSASAEPASVKMPNLVGLNAAVAEDQLRKLGFTEIQFGSADEDASLVILRANLADRPAGASRRIGAAL